MGGQKPETNKNKISVGLLAHVDAGKTTLSEALLYLTGAIRKMGRVDDRDAFLDTYELERERGITIFSKQAVFDLGDKNITLLDTPGHVDFSAEMERTIQVRSFFLHTSIWFCILCSHNLKNIRDPHIFFQKSSYRQPASDF